MLAHILSFVGGGFVAPLVILLVKRKSTFVKFHALQALLINLAVFGLLFGGVFVAMFVTLTKAVAPGIAAGAHPHAPPVALLLIFPIFALGMGTWVVASIVLGVRANAGHWSALPGFGRLTRKLMGST